MTVREMSMADLRRAALLLVGHGSSRNSVSSLPTHRLAEEVRRRGLFAEVRECFWKEAPHIRDVMAEVTAPEVYVVPNFVGEGYFTREVIPRELALAGAGDGRVHYTPPVGAHPRMAGIIRRRVAAVVEKAGVDAARACLLLVGHGSRRPGGSADTALALAATLRRDTRFAEVRVAFLEQEPEVADWRRLTSAPMVVVMPLLVAEGLHGALDLPPLFGLAPDALAGAGDAPAVGPSLVDGRRVWYCRSLGSDPEIVDIILDQVRHTAACGVLDASP
ncbi:MAG: hypothetical protein H7840_03025 [Alphaproteobacteria bacterium]